MWRFLCRHGGETLSGDGATMKNKTKFPEGIPSYYCKAFDGKGGYFVRFIDKENINRPFWVRTKAGAKKIVDNGGYYHENLSN